MNPGGRAPAIGWRVCGVVATLAAALAVIVIRNLRQIHSEEVAALRASAASESKALAAAREASDLTNHARLLASTASILRSAGGPGQRVESLRSIAAAAVVLRNNPPLRDQAVASLILPDLVTKQSRPERGERGLTIGVDPTLASELILGDDGQIRAIHQRRDVDPVVLEHPGGARARELLPHVGATNRMVAVRYANRDIIYWNLDFVAPVHRFTNCLPGAQVFASADGNTAMLARTEPGGVEVVRVESNIRRVQWIPLAGVTSAVPTPDGSGLLAATAQEPGLRVIRLSDGSIGGVLPLRSRPVRWCTSPIAPWLCVLDEDGRLTTWDLQSLRMLRELPGTWPVDSVIGFHPSIGVVAAAGWLGQWHLIDPISGHVWLSAPSMTRGWQFDPGGDGWVARGRLNRDWIRGSLEWLRPCIEIPVFGANPQAPARYSQHGITFSPDGDSIAIAGEVGLVVWDLAHRRRMDGPLIGECFSAVWNSDASALEIQSAVGTQRLPIEVSGGIQKKLGPPQRVDRYTNDCRLSARSSDGRGRAFWAKDRIVVAVTERRTLELPLPQAPEHLALAPDASILCGALPKGEVVAWRTSDGARIWSTNGVAPQRLAFAPNGRWLVSSDGNSLRFWEFPGFVAGRAIARDGDVGAAGVAVFSPDSTLLAVTMSRSELALISVASGELVVRLPNPNRWQVTTLSFDATGRFLAAGSFEGVVTVWNLQQLRTQLSQVGLNWEDIGR